MVHNPRIEPGIRDGVLTNCRWIALGGIAEESKYRVLIVLFGIRLVYCLDFLGHLQLPVAAAWLRKGGKGGTN